MLETTKKMSKKTITLLISCVVILALLIVAVATGGVNNEIVCPDCHNDAQPLCETCGGHGIDRKSVV